MTIGRKEEKKGGGKTQDEGATKNTIFFGVQASSRAFKMKQAEKTRV